MHQPNNLSLPCYRETCQTVPRGPNSTKCSTYTPIQQKKKKKKEIRVRDLKSNPGCLSTSPSKEARTMKSQCPYPAAKEKADEVSGSWLRRIITRNQSSPRWYLGRYKVYFDVSQRGCRIGKLANPGWHRHGVGPYRGGRVRGERSMKNAYAN